MQCYCYFRTCMITNENNNSSTTSMCKKNLTVLRLFFVSLAFRTHIMLLYLLWGRHNTCTRSSTIMSTCVRCCVLLTCAYMTISYADSI